MKRSRLFLMLISARVALSRERRYSRALEAQLEGEKARNVAREDELLTVPMRMLGMYGVATREGRATPIEPLRSQVTRKRTTVQASGWASLTDDERAEWPLYLADVNPDDNHVQQTKREFIEFIRQRRLQESGGEIM